MLGGRPFLIKRGVSIVVVLVVILLLTGSVSAATWNVPGDYSTIQAAVNTANPGDTINVGAETYNENVDVNKSVNLIGAGAGVTIVNASSASDHVFNVTVNWVNISGFTVMGATASGKSGIYLGANNTNIFDTNVTNNWYGISLPSSNNTITNNTAKSNNLAGIFLDSSSNNTITNNNVTLTDGYGIWLDSSGSNTITNNNASNNGVGIEVDSSGSNTITNNTVSNNADGIYLYFSSNNTLTNNTVSNNDNGIFLYSSSNYNTITNNNASNNTYGIFLYSSNNYNTLTNNTVSNNDYGIWLDSSGSNTITNNNASNNTYGISLHSSSNTTLTGNNMTNNRYNLDLYGSQDSHFNNSIDISNTVDGKPIFYIKNGANFIYDSSTNAGTFYCIWCNNVTIKDLTLTKNEYGVLFWGTNNSKIENVNALNNDIGIYLRSSSNNTITNNTYSNGLDFDSAGPSSNTIITNLFSNTRASFTYSGDIRVNSSSSPGGDPQGYSNISKYLNVANTTTAWVYLNISYTDADMGTVPESGLRMWRHNGSWNKVDGSGMDEANNYVYANLTEFSVFAPLGDATPPAVENSTTTDLEFGQDEVVRVDVSDLSTIGTVLVEYDSTNYTMQFESGNTYNVTISAPAVGTHNLKYYANDTHGNMNATTTDSFTATDSTSPTYSSVSRNSTEAGASVLFYAYWQDIGGLSSYIFSWNNSGNWTNETFDMTGSANWSNVTKTLNSTVDIDIGWRIYVNDTSNNWNDTGMRVLTTTDTTSPTITLISPLNNTGDNDGNVTFSYKVTDVSSIANCSLVLNGEINQSDTSIEKDIPQNFSLNLGSESYNWSINCSDSIGDTGSSETRALAVVLSSVFGGDSTDLSNVDISNISNFVLENPNHGKISFSEIVDLSAGADLNVNVNISHNRIEINSTALHALNRSATLYLYDLGFNNPRILRDGNVCPSSICLKIGYSGRTLIFNVTHFSIYLAEETPGAPSKDGGCSHRLTIKELQVFGGVVGGTAVLSVTIENTNGCNERDILVRVSSLPSGWSADNKTIDIPTGPVTVNLTLKIPPSEVPGRRGITVELTPKYFIGAVREDLWVGVKSAAEVRTPINTPAPATPPPTIPALTTPPITPSSMPASSMPIANTAAMLAIVAALLVCAVYMARRQGMLEKKEEP